MKKKIMLTNFSRKNGIYCILVTTRFFVFFSEKVFLKSSKMDNYNCPIFNFSKKNSNEKKPLFNNYSIILKYE